MNHLSSLESLSISLPLSLSFCGKEYDLAMNTKSAIINVRIYRLRIANGMYLLNGLDGNSGTALFEDRKNGKEDAR